VTQFGKFATAMLRRYLSFSIFVLLLSACASHHDILLTENALIGHDGVNAKTPSVAFSSLMRGAPTLVLLANRTRYLIKNDLVERRSANAASQNMTYLPAGVLITLTYHNIEIDNRRLKPAIKGNPLSGVLELEVQRYIETCSDTVAFVPTGSKQYEITFGAVSGKCQIAIHEIVQVLDDGTKIMKATAVVATANSLQKTLLPLEVHLQQTHTQI